MKKGKLIVFSGPSGVGKDTILKKLLKKTQNIELSISLTTRKPRKSEIDGKDYFFIEKEEFLNKVKNGEMLEYANYLGNYYGTLAEKVDEKLNLGVSVILEIETLGASEVFKKRPEALGIFITPPSVKILKKRLENRGTENKQIIKNRLNKAKKELEFSKNYKYIVVNDNLKICVDEILKIFEENL
jgi:guanylate kinase